MQHLIANHFWGKMLITKLQTVFMYKYVLNNNFSSFFWQKISSIKLC